MSAFITSALDVKIWIIYLFAFRTQIYFFFFFDSLNRKKNTWKSIISGLKSDLTWFLMHLSLNGQIRFHVVSPSFAVQRDVTPRVATRRLKDITTLHTLHLPCFYAVSRNECNPLLKCHACWIYASFHSYNQFIDKVTAVWIEKTSDLATCNLQLD